MEKYVICICHMEKKKQKKKKLYIVQILRRPAGNSLDPTGTALVTPELSQPIIMGCDNAKKKQKNTWYKWRGYKALWCY